MAKGTRGGKRAGDGMPELTGSEKQISWAKDIREEFLSGIKESVKKYIDQQTRLFEKGKQTKEETSKQVGYIKEAERFAFGQVRKITVAKEFIDKRNKFTDRSAQDLTISGGRRTLSRDGAKEGRKNMELGWKNRF